MHPYQSSEACPVRYTKTQSKKYLLVHDGLSNGTIWSFVFSELKVKDYALTFNKLLQWSERFLKNSVKMELGWILQIYKQKSQRSRRQKCV